MKSLILTILIIGSLNSCSFNKGIDLESEQYPEKWELVEMSGRMANVPPATGSEMAWQEHYLLYADNTFIKVRKQKKVISKEAGTYSYIVLSDSKYLELSYKTDNKLIGNCTNETKELLFLDSENTMIGTWWACDGPGLVYKKVQEAE